MRDLKRLLLLVTLFQIMVGCYGQQNNDRSNTDGIYAKVGGGCDGCEEMYIGMPGNISAADTSLGWYDNGQKLVVKGTVFKPDGKTPASDVIIYYYQTDESGYYPKRAGIDKQVKNHGSIRGWVKTDKLGQYAIFTTRPAPYPTRDTPAHIHVLIKEPSIENEYYLDDFVFDDDPLVFAQQKIRPFENRGGSGILRPLVSEDLLIAEHNIILGLNIPDYPENKKNEKESGLSIGEDSPSFMPYHAWGPDKGTKVCPICKYGRYHGIVYFVGNKPQWEDIKKWLTFLEFESLTREKYLRVFFVNGNEKDFDLSTRKNELEKIGVELGLEHIALTVVPSFQDDQSEVNLYKINPAVENTFIIYRHRTIIDKYIDLESSPDNFNLISQTLDKTKSEYFDLPESWKNRK